MTKSFLKQCLPYFIIGTLLTALFYSTGYNRNWSFWADQELTLGYNALLINSGLNQEYIDHPGFFSIHLIALLLKVGSLLGLSDINNISQFNQASSMFDAMRYLVISARHAALLTTIALIFGVYYVSKKIFQSVGIALLVAFLAFVSNGVFYHFTATRTEPITFIFLMLALYCFIASYKNNSFKSYYLLQLCLICFFCAALNKAQIIILAPFYFCWAAYFIPNKNRIEKPESHHFVYAFLAALSYAILLYFYSTQSIGLGFVLNALLVSFFNVLVAGIALKIQRNNAFASMTIFNICYLIAFLAVETISTQINLGISIFGNIADPMSMTRFLKGSESIALTSSTPAEGILNAISFMGSPLVETFSKFTSPTLLIGFCLGYLIYHRHSITQKEWWFAGFNLASFYIVNLVNKIRYLDNPHYRIFSEFFLFTFAIFLIYRMPQRGQKRTLGILIFLCLLSNLVPYTNYYNWLIRKGSHPFCQSGLIHFHQKMDANRIELECAQPSAEQ
ncbi:phospholipid carrier-dependent glycosyltransferase [Polynucleobacter sp. UB-Tiil-W10]|uniref:phospholipid carrier-dependent glycosyltransferase n=1 Tax=Polynucleobacter sp. UB-Tiil-W10 TaxID=1855648 RepID=UPI001C0C4ECB|nr:phospholipid carrier-dependent glycosyltransferase [Polynucleobacter sp. UB-Tiil-W10]MBU3540849.1 phospholipid carrier-dependent glycosyltransferase [Polynucleobacter sp. UB-Tiil-W10]